MLQVRVHAIRGCPPHAVKSFSLCAETKRANQSVSENKAEFFPYLIKFLTVEGGVALTAIMIDFIFWTFAFLLGSAARST
jgi:hypothetical protein